MKTKYRVKQVGKKYYPQVKKLFFWWDIEVPMCKIKYGDIYPDEIKTTLAYLSLESAVSAIKQYDYNYLGSFRCRGHKVKTFYLEQENQYIYVDMSTIDGHNPVYSYSSENICELISEKEDERIKKEKADKKVTIHEFTED